MKLPFGDWLPDLPVLDNPGALTAQNCLPVNGAYEPMPGFAATSIGATNAGTYNANATYFNGSSLLTRSADLTGLSDSKTGTVSFWFNTSLGAQILRIPTGLFVYISNGKVYVGGDTSSGTVTLNANTANTYDDSNWHHCIASWDLSSATFQMYIDDVSDATVVTNLNNNISYTGGSGLWPTVGGAGTGDYTGSLSELWFDTTHIDLSNSANRAKFIGSDGFPVNLGSNGSTPTGTSPIIYLKNTAATFGTNSGTGGDFTASGSLSIAPTSPSGETPQAVLGAFGAIDSAKVPYNYIGNATKLAEYNSTTVTNLSKSGGYNSGDYWKFAQYGNKVYATNYADAIQVMDVGGTVFADLSADAPKAKHIAVCGQFLMLGYTNGGTYNGVTAGEMPNRAWWPKIDDPATWPDPLTTTASGDQSSAEDLPQVYGTIQHITNGSDYCIYMQEHALTRFQYVGGDVVFDVVTYDKEHGLYAPNAAAQVGNLVYFLDVGGFFVTDGMSTQPIGHDKVDKTFLADVDTAYLDHIRVTHDAANKVLMWSYVSIGSTAKGSFTVADKMITYNYEDKRWSEITGLSMDIVFQGKTLATTFEDFDSLFNSLDDVTPPPDSPYWNGGNPAIAGFEVEEVTSGSGVYASYYGTFTGAALNAVIDTTEVNLNPGGRAFVKSVKPIVTGASSVTLQPGTRTLLSDAVSFDTAVATDSRTGRCNLRSNDFYHRFRVNITGDFTNAMGVEIGQNDWTPAGMV
jgi:hypothetical protein